MSWYIILPLVAFVVVASTITANYFSATGHVINVPNPTNGSLSIGKSCPSSCDDGNSCTFDYCNDSTGHSCVHTPLNGSTDQCKGYTSTCKINTCVSGQCVQLNQSNCCGNGQCEYGQGEGCVQCPQDCGACPNTSTQSQQSITPTTGQNQTQTAQSQNQTQTTQTTQQNQTSNNLNHIIISEVLTGQNEFIELYNPSNDINTAGWYLSYYSSGNNWNDTQRNWAFPNSTILKSGKFFLINVFNTSNPDWTVLTTCGTPYSVGQISNNGSIAVFPFNPRTKTNADAQNGRIDAQNGRIDALGWGNPAFVFESSPAVTPSNDKSLTRNSLTTDSDNNAQDFSLSTAPTPRNSTN